MGEFNMLVAIDFDGVISKYTKFKGKGIFGEPIDGVAEALFKLKLAKHTIMINTTRSEEDLIEAYLKTHNIPFDLINYNPENDKLGLSPKKQKADVYVDDRAAVFLGKWDNEFIDSIMTFKPW